MTWNGDLGPGLYILRKGVLPRRGFDLFAPGARPLNLINLERGSSNLGFSSTIDVGRITAD
jgi:hypothetical protein